MVSTKSHIEEIERVWKGAPSQRDDAVVRSWLRCLHDYRMNPSQAQEAYIVPNETLREHRDQSEALIRTGRSALEGLFGHVQEQNYVLLLSDARGVTVDFMGDPTFDNHLRRAGLYLGSEWSEQRAGTCAVGACLVSGEPVVIHQDDHFDVSHIGLTCTAAPIFDTLGDVTAVLDISQLRSPTAKASQRLALHLVSTTARRIELANLLARTRNDWVLRLSRLPDFLDVEPDAAIALDGAGRITGTTPGGLRLLADFLPSAGRSARALIGQPLTSLLDLEVDDLPRLMRGRPVGERVVRTRTGMALFASAVAPVASFRGVPDGTAARGRAAIPRALQDLGLGDEAMASLLVRAAKFAPRDLPILIQGETGSGKEFLARAIHQSRPVPGPFVAINCAAVPEHLIESELFGYVPGAFTGAAPRGKSGLIEAAEGGTLFLDEIGDMPLGLQSRLLRVLSEGEFTPVGGHRTKTVRARIISASHHRLDRLVAEGRFREDLFFRLNAATLSLPPLRLRTDFDGLVDQILRRIGEDTGERPRLSFGARLALRAHDWPGNIRELSNALRVASVLAESDEITPDLLPDAVLATRSSRATEAEPRDDIEVKLAACGGNVSELARRLGVDRSTIHRRLRRAAGGTGRA